MSKFVTKNIETVVGRQQFRQLVIVEDNIDTVKLQKDIDTGKVDLQGVLDLYETELETKYAESFRGLIAIMNLVANLRTVPKVKFRDITPDKAKVTEYEFKYQDLRAYAIKIPNGQLILLGGFKNNQENDYSKFRSLKKRFLEKGRY